MALITSLLSLLVLGWAHEVPDQASPKAPGAPMNQTLNQSWSSQNFVSCDCGFTCAQQLGSWGIFQLAQSCACTACSTKSLRGAETSKKNATDVADVSKMLLPSGSWDSAKMNGTNLLYCTSVDVSGGMAKESGVHTKGPTFVIMCLACHLCSTESIWIIHPGLSKFGSQTFCIILVFVWVCMGYSWSLKQRALEGFPLCWHVYSIIMYYIVRFMHMCSIQRLRKQKKTDDNFHSFHLLSTSVYFNFNFRQMWKALRGRSGNGLLYYIHLPQVSMRSVLKKLRFSPKNPRCIVLYSGIWGFP